MLADFEVAHANLSGKIARILSRSFRMSPPIFLAADFKLPIERARRESDDIAAQHAKPLGAVLMARSFFPPFTAIRSYLVAHHSDGRAHP